MQKNPKLLIKRRPPRDSTTTTTGATTTGATTTGATTTGATTTGATTTGATTTGATTSDLSADSGFTCEIPKLNTIRPHLDLSKKDPKCQQWGTYSISTKANISFQEMAHAWKVSGLNMKYCPAALIIGGGECTPVCQDQGCNNKTPGCQVGATGASGIWQVDWARGNSKYNLFNPCDNASAVYRQIVRSPDSYDLGCFSGPNGSITPPLRITGKAPQGGAGGSDYKYYNTSGSDNCNWLGPFCHWQTNKNNNPASCCAWTGGANSYQPQGFPYYYMDTFLKRNGLTAPPCPGSCDQLAAQAMKKATAICLTIK